MDRNNHLREAVIVAVARTPVGKARRGSLASVRPDDLLSCVIGELLSRAEGLDPVQIEDVIIGCAFPEGEQGMNVARIAALRAGLPASVAAETINRFCSSGLQAIAHAAYMIMTGQAEVIIAGGTESMSMVPMTGNKFAPNPFLAAEAPYDYTNMGLTAENVAVKYNISREDQDAIRAALSPACLSGSCLRLVCTRAGSCPGGSGRTGRRQACAEVICSRPRRRTPPGYESRGISQADARV